MNKKIGYGIAGAVLILALVFSLYTPESNLVGYASRSIGVNEIFDVPEIEQLAAAGGGEIGIACTAMNEWEVCPLGWACWNGYCRRPCFDEYDCVDPTFPRCYLGMCLLSERPDPDDGYWAGCGCGKSCWVPYNDDGDDGR